nr:tyrosine-type recombinase/integrase [Sporichthya polymorpha]
MTEQKRRPRRTSGSIRKLPSGRFQARVVADGVRYPARTADDQPLTFSTRKAADAWIARERAALEAGTWTPPVERRAAREAAENKALTFGTYADKWLADRHLAARTADLYRSLLDRHLLPSWGEVPLAEITAAAVREWHGSMDKSKPRAVANAYSLLKTILATAVTDEVIPANPCKVKGASQYRRAKEPSTATLAEIEALREAMPAHYRAAIDLGVWASLRIGEVIGLQRADVDLSDLADPDPWVVIHVRRSVGRTRSGREVKLPKSEAGIRSVPVDPDILPTLREHLESYSAPGRKGWVFPSATDPTTNVSADVLREAFETARHKIGRDDLVFHHLRGIGATWAALAGATVRELQDRLGHTTPNMALAYQRVAQDRPKEIARRMRRAALQ